MTDKAEVYGDRREALVACVTDKRRLFKVDNLESYEHPKAPSYLYVLASTPHQCRMALADYWLDGIDLKPLTKAEVQQEMAAELAGDPSAGLKGK